MFFLKNCTAAVIVLVLTVLTNVSAQSGTAYNYWTMKAFGANLGNWLVLEKWMDPSFFDTHNVSEAVDEWTFCEQAVNPAMVLEEHWNSWITEDDFQLLASVNANHVRIPIGYWAFIQPDANEPYVSTGQKAQIERILSYCAKYNIYAVIDLHGMPGSQNGEHHSGHDGQKEFYTDYNMQRSLNTIRAVVDWMNNLNSTLKARISSIQPVNEPRVVGNELEILKRFYMDAFNIINASPFKVPMMFHDAFQGLETYYEFLRPPSNAVIDLHPYHAFPPNTNSTSIINNICGTKASVENFHIPVFFGEWSLASGVPNSDTWLREMMDTQVYVFKNGGAGGTFWALKNKINSSAWSLEQLIMENIVNATTFSHHINEQCSTAFSTTALPTTVSPTTVSPTTVSPNVAVQSTINVFLFFICLIVCISNVNHELK